MDGSARQVLLKGVNVDGLVDYFRPDLASSYPIAPAAYGAGACPADDPSVEGVDTVPRLCASRVATQRTATTVMSSPGGV